MLDPEKSTKVLYLRVPGALKEQLDWIAREAGLTLTAAATEVLRRGLSSGPVKTAADRVEEAIGAWPRACDRAAADPVGGEQRTPGSADP